MATYYMNEGAFELVDLAFEDLTTHVLETTHPEHGEVAVIVRRTRFPADKSLRDLVDGHLADEKKRMTGYTVIEQRDGERGPTPFVEVAVRFRDDGLAFYQKQAHLALPDTWMLIAINTPMGARAACDAWLEEALASLQLRGE